jgi:hypothetical protein
MRAVTTRFSCLVLAVSGALLALSLLGSGHVAAHAGGDCVVCHVVRHTPATAGGVAGAPAPVALSVGMLPPVLEHGARGVRRAAACRGPPWP